MNTYEKIKKLCENEGFAISSITEKIPNLNVTVPSITGWKKGAKPRPDKVKAIADYFNVSIEYLLNEEEIKEEPQQQNPSLTDEQRELIEAFKNASPELQAAALAVLRAKDGK